MNLSSLYGNVPKFFEFAWVTTTTDGGQQIAANTNTVLFLNRLITENSSFSHPDLTLTAGTKPALNAQATSEFSLPVGTFAYETIVPYGIGGVTRGAVLSLFNKTDNSVVNAAGSFGGNVSYGNNMVLKGQIRLSAKKAFQLRMVSDTAIYLHNGVYNSISTSYTTAGNVYDQRTTIKFWWLDY